MEQLIRITNEPVSIDEVLSSVRSDDAGAVACFIGTVRSSSEGFEVTGVEVESAEDLAVPDLERICVVARRQFPVIGISMAHRKGSLKVGDVIVVIAVSAAHRADAFGACRFIIDELKKTTPIWKKEFGPEESRWVGPGK